MTVIFRLVVGICSGSSLSQSVKGLSPLVDVDLFLVPVLLRIMFAVTIHDNFLHHFGRPRESGGSPVT